MGYRSITQFLTTNTPHPKKKAQEKYRRTTTPNAGFELIRSEFYSFRETAHTDTNELFIVIVKSMVTADAEPFKRYTSKITITH